MKTKKAKPKTAPAKKASRSASKKAAPAKKKQAFTLKKKADATPADADTEQACQEADCQKPDVGGSFESSVETSFFYTSDKILDALDDSTIISKIIVKFPNLSPDKPDPLVKKEIVAFLNDKEFICGIMSYYGLTIMDVFKLLYKSYPSVFKGPFLKKLKKELRYKSYARPVRR